MGVNNNIDITKLSPKIQEMLNSFSSTITDQVKVLAKETAEDLTDNTKRDSPKKTGDYKKHITYKKTKETTTSSVYTWYVKDPEYRLTHLIANGHAKRNGGRTKSNDYLSKNVIEAETNFVKGVKEIIENGR